MRCVLQRVKIFLYHTTKAHSSCIHEINVITYLSLVLWQCHVVCLFNETFSSCDCRALNGILMTTELYMIWKESHCVPSALMSRNFPEGTEKEIVNIYRPEY
jgi:hypothetical protein